jgi:hypothetical protein
MARPPWSSLRWLYGRVSLRSALKSAAGGVFYANPSDQMRY